MITRIPWRRLLTLLGLLALAALSFGVGRLYPVLVRPPLVVGQDAMIEGTAKGVTGGALLSASYPASYMDAAGGYLIVRPVGESRTLFIFYPGGLVRPQAYEWLGHALAPLGVTTVIPRFPFDLAVTAPNRAARLLEHLNAGGAFERVILGGHSLGGAMAVRFVKGHPESVDALVLMGAFGPASDDLSSVQLPTLVLAAQNDGLATLGEVREGMSRLPADAQFVEIEGAVHAFFGRYGPQRGDGLPTVSRGAAEADILAALTSFLKSLE